MPRHHHLHLVLLFAFVFNSLAYGGESDNEIASLVSSLRLKDSRDRIVYRLRNFERHKVYSQLFKSSNELNDINLRLGSIYALGELRYRRALKHLHATLSESDPAILHFTVHSLGRIGCPSSIAPLTSIITRVGNATRIEIAKALGHMESTKTVKALIILLNDSSYSVQYSAMLALQNTTALPYGNDIRKWLTWARNHMKLLNDTSALKSLLIELSRADSIRSKELIQAILCINPFPLHSLITYLKSTASPENAGALIAIAAIGPKLHTRRKQLLAEALLSSNVVREYSKDGTTVLNVLHSLGDDIIPVLVRNLSSNSTFRSNSAYSVLELFGLHAVKYLIKSYLSPKSKKYKITSLLRELGLPAVDMLITQICKLPFPNAIRLHSILPHFGMLAVNRILIAARSNSLDVRLRLGHALSSCARCRLSVLILNAYNDDSRVREVVVQGLAGLSGPRVIETLLAKLQDNSHTVRCHAAISLGRAKDTRALSPLLTLFHHPNEWVRKYSRLSFIHAAKSSSKEALLDLLKSQDSDIRSAAIEKIWCLNIKVDTPHVMSLTHDSDSAVRFYSYLTLGNHYSAGLSDRLYRVWNDTSFNPKTRFIAASSDYRLCKRKEALAFLQRCVNTKSTPFRAFALIALGYTKSPEAVKCLLHLLHERNPMLWTIGYSIGLIGKPASSSLFSLLGELEIDKAKWAVLSLNGFWISGFRPHRDLLKDKSPVVRAISAQSLGECYDESSSHLLLDAFLLEKNDSTKASMIQALGLLRCKAAVPHLLEILSKNTTTFDSKYNRLRIAARHAIVRIGIDALPEIHTRILDNSNTPILSSILTDIGDYSSVPVLIKVISKCLPIHGHNSTRLTIVLEAINRLTGLSFNDSKRVLTWHAHFNILHGTDISNKLRLISHSQRHVDICTTDLLIKACNDSSSVVSGAARCALVSQLDKRLEILSRFLYSVNPKTRKACASVLYESSSFKSIPLFIDYLENSLFSWKDWDGCRIAKRHLTRVSGKHFSYDIKKWRHWYKSQVRQK